MPTDAPGDRFSVKRLMARRARHELEANDPPAAASPEEPTSARRTGRLRTRAAEVVQARRAASLARRSDRPGR
jgi:hypothetical protein